MKSTKTEEFSINTPGGKIYAKKWIPENCISDTPIILLHDSLGSVDLWRDFPEILASRMSRCVIAYDRLGFGKSDARIKVPSFKFIEEEATTFFPYLKKHLQLASYILFGHSVGGAMAINIAASDENCVAVVTVSSQAFVEDITIAGIKNAKKAFQQPGQIERLEKWHGNKAEWVLRAWTDVWLSSDFAPWSLETCIGSVICPVLAIHGDKDEFGTKAFPEFITSKTGGKSRMVMIKSCGHNPHREKPQEVIEALESFCHKHLI